MQLAVGDWIFIVDSDHYLSSDAVEKILKWISIHNHETTIGIISASRFDVGKKEALSTPDILINNPGLRCFNYDRYKYCLEKDRAEVYRTDLLKSHPFLEFENEYFVTKAVCWNSLALDSYYTVFYSDVIYFYEYLCGGLTKNSANGYIGRF